MLYVLMKVKILTHITTVKKNRSGKLFCIGLHIYFKYLFLDFSYIIEYDIFYFRLKSILGNLAAKIMIAYFVESQMKRFKIFTLR